MQGQGKGLKLTVQKVFLLEQMSKIFHHMMLIRTTCLKAASGSSLLEEVFKGGNLISNCVVCLSVCLCTFALALFMNDFEIKGT